MTSFDDISEADDSEFVWDATSASADKYDPAKFYCPTSDKKGHFAEIRLRVPPRFPVIFQRLQESRLFPEAATRVDYGRNLMVHGLHVMTEHIANPPLQQMMRQEVANCVAQEALDLIILRDEIDKQTYGKSLRVLKRITAQNKNENLRAVKTALGTIFNEHLRQKLQYEIGKYE